MTTHFQTEIETLYVDEKQSLVQISRKLHVPIRDVRQVVQARRLTWNPLREFVKKEAGSRVLIFDLETTGLPCVRGFNQYYPYTHLEAYANARIIQLAFVSYALGSEIPRAEISSAYRSPEGFQIQSNAQSIHGISLEFLEKEGKPIRDILAPFLREVEKSTHILAHNASFDVNILKNELFRLGYLPDEIDSLLPESKVVCTCRLTDFTRLGTLYGWISTSDDEELVLHNAQDDVFALVKILNFLLHNNKYE